MINAADLVAAHNDLLAARAQLAREPAAHDLAAGTAPEPASDPTPPQRTMALVGGKYYVAENEK